jgi:hypothetical protein
VNGGMNRGLDDALPLGHFRAKQQSGGKQKNSRKAEAPEECVGCAAVSRKRETARSASRGRTNQMSAQATTS